jgi:hypothetical protein
MTEKPLNQKILSWLGTQGYGVEMEVAKSLSAAEFQVVQSWFYTDPETETSREIDVVGRMADAVGLLSVYAVIECKKSSKPWVLFTSEQAAFNRVSSLAIMTDDTRGAIAENIQSMLEIDWFRKDGRVAYGITEAFTSKEDATFRAGMTVTKASVALLKREVNSSGRGFLSLFFPTVVLDGRLFECYLGSDSNPIVEETDSGFLLFPIKLGDYGGTSVRVVTLSSLNSYCNDIGSLYHSLKRVLSGEIAKAASSLGISLEASLDQE